MGTVRIDARSPNVKAKPRAGICSNLLHLLRYIATTIGKLAANHSLSLKVICFQKPQVKTNLNQMTIVLVAISVLVSKSSILMRKRI